jgi:hypothetical protein
MAYKTIKDEYGDYEIFYEENCPENSDYLPKTKIGIKKAFETLDITEERVKFKLNRERSDKLISRIQRIKERREELNDWRKSKFPTNKELHNKKIEEKIEEKIREREQKELEEKEKIEEEQHNRENEEAKKIYKEWEAKELKLVKKYILLPDHSLVSTWKLITNSIKL